MPKRSEDLKIDIERALKGKPYRDRETSYILAAKAEKMTWHELMALPYRIFLKMNLVRRSEMLFGGLR